MTDTVYQSHISLLKSTAALFPSANAFKIPIYDGDTIKEWEDVTYKQFYDDVERMAIHWIENLALPPSSVVAVWLYGVSYSDIVTIFCIARAGYVPQLISPILESPITISQMLAESKARALIYDLSSGFTPEQFQVPLHLVVNVKSLSDLLIGGRLPPVATTGNPDDIVMFYNTSGSTSSRPNVIPVSRKWLNILAIKVKYQTPIGHFRPVITMVGSLSHVAQLCQFIRLLPYGVCHILVKVDFSSKVLIQMVEQCGLNTLNLFSVRLIPHLKTSRNDPRLLSVLKAMYMISCSGGPLPKEEFVWACSNKIPISMMYGMTETGPLLRAVKERGEKPVYKTIDIEGLHHAFVPVEDTGSTGGKKLSELVVLADSLDCPSVSIRATDGHFHTRDTFEEVAPGCYIYRGRLDDRIKMLSAGLCDAKGIEENANQECSDLITGCVVVGVGHPFPTLIVEANLDYFDKTKLKAQVADRIAVFNEGLFPYEQIKPSHIIVVESGTLPRTMVKGNIRRPVVEEQFKVQLDELYH